MCWYFATPLRASKGKSDQTHLCACLTPFVLLPLQPGCKYLIQLRAEGNDHIERALPQHRTIEVSTVKYIINIKADLKTLNKIFIALVFVLQWQSLFPP